MYGTKKVMRQGTHRVRLAEETWEMIAPRLPHFGVTRIADVTGLDTLGLPVAMAVRPTGWTLSVSQGKGQTLTLAKVSGAMECVELWHAERACPPVIATGVAAAELGLPYSVREIGVEKEPLLSDRTPMDWLAAEGMTSGRCVPVPRGSVMFGPPDRFAWTGAGMRSNSNGLASGNIREEAAVHALYELIERDALSRAPYREMISARRIDPASIPDETCQRLVGSVLGAGGKVAIAEIPNIFGVPTFWAVIWSWDFDVPCAGYGSHLDPVVAVSRALTEAGQGRLTAISGSRDDLQDFYGLMQTTAPRSRNHGWFGQKPEDFSFLEPVAAFDDVAEEARWLATLVKDRLDSEPLLVDLSTEEDFAVVKVIVPGAYFDGSRVHDELERVV